MQQTFSFTKIFYFNAGGASFELRGLCTHFPEQSISGALAHLTFSLASLTYQVCRRIRLSSIFGRFLVDVLHPTYHFFFSNCKNWLTALLSGYRLFKHLRIAQINSFAVWRQEVALGCRSSACSSDIVLRTDSSHGVVLTCLEVSLIREPSYPWRRFSSKHRVQWQNSAADRNTYLNKMEQAVNYDFRKSQCLL